MIVYHGSNLSIDGGVDVVDAVDVDDVVDHIDHSSTSALMQNADLISHHSDEAKARNCFETGLICNSVRRQLG